MNDDRDYWEGQVFALRTLESLPIYLWPLDLAAWCSWALNERLFQDSLLFAPPHQTHQEKFQKGCKLVFDLVSRLPLFGMAWRLQRMTELLSESKEGIDPDDPDLWRRD